MKKKTISVGIIVSLFMGMFASVGIAAPAYAATAPTSSELNTTRTTILNQTNQARAAQGLPPVVLNNTINTQSQNCSQQQATNNTMAHCDNYVAGYPGGWFSAGENVAAGYHYSQVVNGWMNSPGHRANILNGAFTDMGIGYYFGDDGRAYYTQNFGGYTSTTTIPGAVRDVAAVAQANGSVNVLFSAPVYNGNTAITNYTITATASGQATVTRNVPNAGTNNITGLTPGVQWTISVVANNARGAGVAAPTATVTPTGAPTVQISSIDVTSTTGQVNFTYNANGSQVTNISVARQGQAAVNIPTNSQWYVFSNLTPGTSYSGNISVTNANGTTTIPFTFETEAVAPDAPAISTVLETSTSLKVNWTPPAFNGGADITGYTVTLYDINDAFVGKADVNASTRTYTFKDLTRGTDYTVHVTATNRAGTSTSKPQTVNVPYTNPTVPTNVHGDLTDERQVTLTWNAPVDNGGIELQNYRIEVYAGSELQTTITAPANATSRVISDLKASTLYTFRVIAVNAVSLSSVAGVSNVVNIPATPTAPDAVENLRVGNVTSNSFTVNWDEPLNNGGAAVEYYNWTVRQDGAVVDSGTVTGTSVRVTGLDRFTTYTVTVSAVNNRGQSADAAVNQKTLATVPSAPTITSVEPLTPESVKLTIASANNGGDSALTYNATVYLNGQVVWSGSTNATGVFNIDGLTVNTEYAVEFTATNSAGTSTAGSGSISTPATSDPVTLGSTTQTPSSVTTRWSAPVETGAYPLTGYLVEYLNSENTVIVSQRVSNSTLSHTVNITENSKLRNGKAYTIRVTPLTYTTDLKGESTERTFTTQTRAPFASSNLTATFEGKTLKATWNAPANDGGSAVTNYRVALLENGSPVETVFVNDTEFTYEVTSPNTEYQVTVQAINSVGASPNTISSAVLNSGVFPPSTPELTTNVTNNNKTVAVEVEVANNGGAPVTATEYRVAVNGAEFGEWVTVPALTFNINVEPGSYYTIEARVSNSGGTSPVGSTLVTVNPVAPNKVENITLTPGETNVEVVWSAPGYTGGAPITSYDVVLKNANDETVNSVTVTGTSQNFTGLTRYTQYYVEITANNVAGESVAKSNTVRTQPGVAPTATDITFSQVGSTTVGQVNVTPPTVSSDLSALLRARVSLLDADGKVIANKEILGSTRTTTFDLERGKAYKAQVVYYYAGYATSASQPFASETLNVPAVAPDAVSNLNVAFNRLDATISWNAGYNGGATQQFSVEVVNTETDEAVYSQTVTGSPVTVTGLAPNTAYEVSVTAVNEVGSSVATTRSIQTAIVEPSSARNVTGNVNGTNITFNWSAPAETGGGTVTYNYVVNSDNDGVVKEGTTDSTTVDYTGLRGDTYTITVTAVNSAGSASPITSNAVFVTPIAPSPVGDLQATADTQNNITLSWTLPLNNGGSPVAGYEVTTSKGTFIVNSTKTVLSQEEYGFEPATDYNFSVVAVNNYGVSAPASVEVTTNVVAPGAPKVALDYNDETLELTVGYVAGSTGGEEPTYKVTITRNGEAYYTGAIENGSGTFLVTRGAEYEVTVTATNSAGSTTSETVTQKVAAIAPSAPVNVAYTLSEDNDVVLSWDAPSYDGGATVTSYRWTVVNDEEEVLETGTTTERSATFTLPANTPVSVVVTAINSAGESVNSDAVNFTTNIVSPSGLDVKVEVTSNTATFTGTVADNGGAEITTQSWTVTDGEGNVVGEGEGETYTVNGLIHATDYKVEFTVSNGTAAPASVVVDFKTAPIAPSAPTDVKADVAGETSATVSWTAPADNGGSEVTGYVVAFSDQGNVHTGTVNSTGVTTEVKGLNRGSVYTFTVTAVNAAGESVESEVSNTVETAPVNAPTPLPEKLLLENWDSFSKLDVVLNGDVITVKGIDESYLNEWLAGFGYSDPTFLGWSYNRAGEVQFNVSALPAGDHSLAVYGAQGNVVGVAEFAIAETPTAPETPAGETGGNEGTTGNGSSNNANSNGSGKTSGTSSNVEQTGVDTNGWLLLSGGFFLAALASIVYFRRRQTVAVKSEK